MKQMILLLSLAAVMSMSADSLASANTSSELCQYTAPYESVYKAEFVDDMEINLDEETQIFTTVIHLKNIGTESWFGYDSGCTKQPIFNLGTDKERDRISVFFMPSLGHTSSWVSPNRIIMNEDRVDPGETATFEFLSYAPQTDDIFREYYQPVVEGLMWLDDVIPPADYYTGEYTDDMVEKLEYMDYSGKVSTLLLDDLKWLEVNLSEQKLYLWIDDQLVKTFPVSSGKASTPSPTGITTITHKQEVRVGGAWPHYIMPKWMTYKAGGYGFHALPSLANDGGVFWTEALEHIGIPVSHGCIRLLPDDATYVYDFTPIGATVNVHY